MNYYNSLTNVYAATLFEPGDIVKIVNTKCIVVAGDVLGKRGTVIERAWEIDSEVLVQLCGETNYRAFCLENVCKINEAEIMKPKFKLGEYVFCAARGIVGSITKIEVQYNQFHCRNEIIYTIREYGTMIDVEMEQSWLEPYDLTEPTFAHYSLDEATTKKEKEMTYTKPTFLGNYIHSEPKFIGAFPDRKDYPFNTRNYDIQVDGQHKQPEAKLTINEPTHTSLPGVYIAECSNASFCKEPNGLPLPQGVRISTIAPTHPVTIGTPETFKKGDRVKVVQLSVTTPSKRYNASLNMFGVVDTAGVNVMVELDNYGLMTYAPRDLKKEFAVGDRVASKQSCVFCIVKHYAPATNTYLLAPLDGSSDPWWTIGENLTYAPEEKKEEPGVELRHPDGTILGRGTVPDYVKQGMAEDHFKLNQPIHLDKQAENRLHIEDVHKVDIRFMTQAEIDRELVYKHYLYMPEVKIEYTPQTTYSATIVLASGRVVNIPDPNEKDWALKSTEKVTRIEPVLLDHEEGNEDVDEFVLNSFVEHEEGLCWLKDMARIIEQKDVVSPFETKFSYVTEIRKYVRKTIETPAYECTLPALRCLW